MVIYHGGSINDHPEPLLSMSRPNAFMPIWPPAGEVDFEALPAVRKARTMFRAQKACLSELADRALRSKTGAETHYLSQEIAALLHNISGTAAYFGEAAFGTFAGEIEQPVRTAFTAELLRPLCARIQARLTPEEID